MAYFASLAALLEPEASSSGPVATPILLWSVAVALASQQAMTLDASSPLAELAAHLTILVPDAPPEIEGCDLLGRAYEYLMAPADRRKRGAHFTPTSVADVVAAAAIPEPLLGPVTVCDPACGGGALLLAAARRMASSGVMKAIVVEHMYGCDIDPLATAVTDAALALWSGGRRANIVHGDGLMHDGLWGVDQFDVVIGNPPFLNQLGTATVRSLEERTELSHRFGSLSKGYSDTAAIFLVRGVQLTHDGGRVAMILPESILTTAATEPVRRWVTNHGRLEAVWIPGSRLFDAQVRVCVPVIAVEAPGDPKSMPVVLITGHSAERHSTYSLAFAHEWSALGAHGQGIPTCVLVASDKSLDDLAICTADFRDQYYGLIPHVFEADDPRFHATPPTDRASLVSVGLIDLGVQHWGARAVKFGGATYREPVVDLNSLAAHDPKLAAWASHRLVPKILVATQTKVVEAVADVDGVWLPSVPVLSVIPRQRDDLWRVMAVLCHPMISAWLAHQAIGSGLSAATMRLRANQLAAVPLPLDPGAWSAAALAVQRNDWLGLAAIDLYGPTSPDVASWWLAHVAG